jgi:hypothetical protein
MAAISTPPPPYPGLYFKPEALYDDQTGCDRQPLVLVVILVVYVVRTAADSTSCNPYGFTSNLESFMINGLTNNQ